MTFDYRKHILLPNALFYMWLCIFPFVQIIHGSRPVDESEPSVGPHKESELDLAAIPFKIIYKAYRETNGKENWELFLMNADGSNPVNLTQTPETDELSAHASPDGTKVCFVADEGTGRNKVSNVYYMNINGAGRVKVADNAREPYWSPDSKTIAYMKCEFERYTTRGFNTKGLFFYDIQSGKHRQHPNKDLHHLYNICWSQDGNWFVVTAHGGMGFAHGIVAFPVGRKAVFDLTKYGVTGCTPDLSLDGRMLIWNKTDWDLCVGRIDLTSTMPRVRDVRKLVKCNEKYEVYNTDFSPDGRYITFHYGPLPTEAIGEKTPGWNICVSDLNGTWVQVTADGHRNQDPDWVPITKGDL
jgi:Tol biopolymer transport system component